MIKMLLRALTLAFIFLIRIRFHSITPLTHILGKVTYDKDDRKKIILTIPHVREQIRSDDASSLVRLYLEEVLSTMPTSSEI